MRTAHPNRTFSLLLGIGLMVVLLMGAAAYRAVLAGCPDGIKMSLTCLFFPTHTDLGVHLVSYLFIAFIFLLIATGLIMWRRQRNRTLSLVNNLVITKAADAKLDELLLRVGLKDKVSILDSANSLSFCAGFLSPHIYISQAIVDSFTSEQLEALLLHEKQHLDNYDPIKTLISRLFATVLFLIPFLEDILNGYLVEKEIAADQKAIHIQGHNRGIAGALNMLLQKNFSLPNTGWTVGGSDSLEYRIESLFGTLPPKSFHISLNHIIISFVVIATLLILTITPFPGSHPVI